VLVNVFVQENEVALLKKGANVSIQADAYPGIRFKGKVSAIIPVASAAKTFPVEIKIANNKAQKLLAGGHVQLFISSGNLPWH